MPDSNASQPEAKTCQGCGQRVPPNAPGGLCPTCLLEQGVRLATETQVKPGLFIPPSPAELGLLFPDFNIESCLGHGGMGAVYKAHQIQLQRPVAIKILPPETALDPEFSERFRREAATLARLDHPNIVRLFDYGQSDAFAYFIMEYVDGPNLAEHLQQGAPSLPDIVQIISQLCDALHHSHERGIVHRDIKPANLLLHDSSQLKVADFGLARLLHPQDLDPALTRTRASLGTPRYMAPEQMDGSPHIDHRADLYAVGVVLYEMLTGQTPTGHFEAPSSIVPTLSPRLDEVVLQALRTDPNRRFAFALQLKQALLQAVAQPGLNRFQQRRRLATQVLAVSCLTALLGAGLTLVWTQFQKRPSASPTRTDLPTAFPSLPTGRLSLYGRASSLPPPDPNATFTSIRIAAAREEFAVALRPDGSLMVWGGNRFGQTQPPPLHQPVLQVAVGQGKTSAHALALLADGSVVGWGDNTFQQAHPPDALRDLEVAAVAAGELHSVALTKEGRVLAWGSLAGQPASVPLDMPPAQAIAAGADFNLALLADGSVMAWGDNTHQQCDLPRFPGPVVEITAGYHHALARLKDGRIIAWGDRSAGQCDVPRGGLVATRIFAGDKASAALDAQGRLHAWGIIPADLPSHTPNLLTLSIGTSSWALLTTE